MTSARQGPWTDIYGLSATLYHAITGAAPPSAFDRMLDDEYQPLAKKAPPGFGRGLLVGLDAGLAVRASDRPQSIAGWRPILGQAAAPDAAVTVAIAPSPPTVQPRPSPPPRRLPAAAPPAKKRGIGLWVGGAVCGDPAAGRRLLRSGRRQDVAPQTAAQDAQLAAEAQRLKDQEELARLRADNERRLKAEQEAAQRKQAEMSEADEREEPRLPRPPRRSARKTRAQKAEASERGAKKVAEAGESGLRLTVLDRQHAQIALKALGFATGSTNGTFGSRTREAIAAWQKSRNEPTTGYLTGAQNQALLRDAAPAIARFDDEQKKLEEARKKAEEDKAKAEAAARTPAPAAAPPPPPPSPAAPAPAAPSVAAAAPRAGPDGQWAGTYHCSPSRAGGAEFNARFQITLVGRRRHLGPTGLGIRHDGRQPVALDQGHRLAGRGLARLHAGQPGRRVPDGDDDGALRGQQHHGLGPGAQ